jgi:ABC-type multidrug transport system permease subunit
MVGITFSTLAKNQMQAMQMIFFFFLPSLLLSGFMFPFRGMPVWAQYTRARRQNAPKLGASGQSILITAK